MSAQVNVQDAKTRLSELLKRVEDGEEITISRAGRPVARLVAVEPLPRRSLGFAREIPDLPDALLFDPLDEKELAAWEGR